MITFLLFAQLAQQAGMDSVELNYVKGRSVRDYLADLIEKIPNDVDLIQEDVVLVAVNQQFADWDIKPQEGDEVALLPPFSGG